MTPSMRITRKVKLDGQWKFASVPLTKSGRPEVTHVVWKGERVAVAGGSFYLDHGHGKNRKHVACGPDPEAVVRAMQTQVHVLELRGRGMDVGDAPEIADHRRREEKTLREMHRAFKADPPSGFTVKTAKKYLNALDSFARWAEGRGVARIGEVTAALMGRWIGHMQRVELLDASTIVPKVRIVLAELKAAGVAIQLADRDMPSIIERTRDIYTMPELDALFAACGLDEFELLQTFLLTGMRYREVAFLCWDDVDRQHATVKVTAKRDLGFVPKAYHERTVPVPRQLIDLLEARGIRRAADGAGLIFPTGSQGLYDGGKFDRKMLVKLKQIARRSGLNCGRCMGTYKGEAVTCKTHAVCRRWGLHKFRHTYATNMLRDKIDIVTVSRLLGHKDLATTRIYLRALEAEEAQPQVERSTLAMRFGLKTPPAAGRPKIATRLRG